MRSPNLLTLVLLAAFPLALSACLTQPSLLPPISTVKAQCPEAPPILDRSFKVQPPMCTIARQQFHFQCTEDPAKPGYCKETFSEIGLQAAGAIADPETCLRQTADWIAGEKVARGM